MPNDTPVSNEWPGDELTEDLKALRAFRDELAQEYKSDPEKFRARFRESAQPGYGCPKLRKPNEFRQEGGANLA